MKFIGLYITAKGKKQYLIDDQLLKDTVEKAISLTGVKLLKTSICKYPRGGTSMVLFVASSHIALHTWPEYSMVILEIFLCKGDPLTAWRYIKESLKLQEKKINKIVYEVG